jgi:hypothetical protein
VAALGKLESKRLAGKTNQAAEETEVRAAWYVLQREDGKSNRGPTGLDDGETKREQRQEETETTVLKSKSNRTQKKATIHMSNKNQFFH